MKFESFSFGSVQIDGVTYEHDIVIDRGEVRRRKKGPSKKFRDMFGHTPISIKEKIPWKCQRLVIGTGTGALPVMEQVKKEARRREIKLFIAPTERAIELLKQHPAGTNAVLHVTC
ncbi:MAG TPA: MTH938/NDUFAF3 family protein [Terriglobales bacterium]|nr:MTH938/NDUFAF3 family protein [Terriglobales bacterium]